MLLNNLGKPRVEALHGSDVLGIWASGFCFGIAIVFLLMEYLPRRESGGGGEYQPQSKALVPAQSLKRVACDTRYSTVIVFSTRDGLSRDAFKRLFNLPPAPNLRSGVITFILSCFADGKPKITGLCTSGATIFLVVIVFWTGA